MSSTETTIQSGLVSLLTSAEADLRIDDRTVTIVREWMTPISARDMPLVVVNLPELDDSTTWSATHQRRVYVVLIECFDPRHHSPTKLRSSRDRVMELRENVEAALRAQTHLNLVALRVFESHCRYTPVPVEDIADCHRAALELTIPVIVPR